MENENVLSEYLMQARKDGYASGSQLYTLLGANCGYHQWAHRVRAKYPDIMPTVRAVEKMEGSRTVHRNIRDHSIPLSTAWQIVFASPTPSAMSAKKYAAEILSGGDNP